MKGIYATAYSYKVVVNLAAGRKEKRFPLDTPPAEMKRWREEQIGKFATLSRRPSPTAPATRGTLAADVKTYLSGITMSSKGSRASDLGAWVARLGHKRRDKITQADVQAAVYAWQQPRPETSRYGPGRPYSSWTIKHRLDALRALYKALDDPDDTGIPTPVDRVIAPKPPAAEPLFISPAQIMAVAASIAHPHTRARFLVLATHGVRPIELARAKPEDVDLKHKLWTVRTAKGGLGRALRLNAPEMRAAWRAFMAAKAWGPYDPSTHVRRLRAAGWPKGVRPYALRGTWGMELSRRGVDLADIQQLMGHKDIETTRHYYVPPEDSRLSSATTRLSGRMRIRR
jgi:integrase